MTDVLVVIGPAASPARKGDLAALGFGRLAAELAGGRFDVLLLGPDADAASRDLVRLGARSVFTLEHPGLASYTAEAYAAAAAAFLEGRRYRLLAAATSSATKEYFPRLAALLDAPMASDVLAIDSANAEAWTFTRAVFVGNILETVELRGLSLLATCRASEFDTPPGAAEDSPVERVTVESELAHPRKRFVRLERARSGRPDLKEADVVVSVGRGTRGPAEGIALCEELADVLGAAIGATRAVVDAGWLPNELQVGQTGKIVAPKLYVAIGLSGSIQHLAGMRNSKAVVAINKDPDAPIFEVADVGLVADLFEAVPALTQAICDETR